MRKTDSVIDGGRREANFRLLLEGIYESAEWNGQLLSPDDLAEQAYAWSAAREPERTAPSAVQELVLEYLRRVEWEVCAERRRTTAI